MLACMSLLRSTNLDLGCIMLHMYTIDVLVFVCFNFA